MCSILATRVNGEPNHSAMILGHQFGFVKTLRDARQGCSCIRTKPDMLRLHLKPIENIYWLVN